MRNFARVLSLILLGAFATGTASAYDGLVEKKTFTMPTYTTMGGGAIKNVRVGYESYGKLNAARDNVILITHFFSGTSHAAGKYKADDAAPGYWDMIIGAGKPIDTDKYFVISSDTLVNLGAKDPTVVTTGPASINPDTGKPYGLSFPMVTIRDFVNVQKTLLDSLGISRLHAVMGASMGALQAFEWAAAYPDMVARTIPVIGTADVDAFTLGWLDIWAAPIRLDANWNNGDYYGRTEPLQGLATALQIVTLHANHPLWADAAFGRKWAEAEKNPALSLGNLYSIEKTLMGAGAARAKTSDANHFLYLVRANQTFTVGYKATVEDGLAAIKAKVLLLPAKNDLIFPPEKSRQAMATLQKNGRTVEYFELEGTRGHLDGLFAITKANDVITRFLAN